MTFRAARGLAGLEATLGHWNTTAMQAPAVQFTTTTLDSILSRGRAPAFVHFVSLDIEGAEYEVLNDLCARGRLGWVRQLLVEFHHRATHYTMAETQAVVARIEKSGFRLVHVEGRNHIFRRKDLG